MTFLVYNICVVPEFHQTIKLWLMLCASRIDDWGVEEETMPFIADWLLAHMQDAKALGKPLIMQEVSPLE